MLIVLHFKYLPESMKKRHQLPHIQESGGLTQNVKVTWGYKITISRGMASTDTNKMLDTFSLQNIILLKHFMFKWVSLLSLLY